MKKTKVMLFSHISDPERITGAEKMLLTIAQNLAESHEVWLLVPGPGIIAAEAETLSINILSVDFPLTWSLYQATPSIQSDLQGLHETDLYRHLVHFFYTHRPDWIIVNTVVASLPALAAKEVGIPVAWILTEVLYSGGNQIQSVSIVNQASDYLIGISQAVLAPFLGTRSDPTMLLMPPTWNHLPLEPEKHIENRARFRETYNIPNGNFVVGVVAARLADHKGIIDFIMMASMLIPHFPNVTFVIVGSQEQSNQRYVEDCKKLIAAASSEPSRFIIHPFERDVTRVYPALDLLVVPSIIDEGFGMTALEGMSFGIPVVAYAAGGLTEILNRTENGDLLVPKGDVSALAEKVSGLLSDPQRLGTTGARNYQKAVEVFGPDVFKNNVGRMIEYMDQSVPQFGENSGFAGADFFTTSGEDMYLRIGRKLHPITSREAFLQIGGVDAEVKWIPEQSIHSLETGRPISLYTPANGLAAKNVDTGLAPQPIGNPSDTTNRSESVSVSAGAAEGGSLQVGHAVDWTLPPESYNANSINSGAGQANDSFIHPPNTASLQAEGPALPLAAVIDAPPSGSESPGENNSHTDTSQAKSPLIKVITGPGPVSPVDINEAKKSTKSIKPTTVPVLEKENRKSKRKRKTRKFIAKRSSIRRRRSLGSRKSKAKKLKKRLRPGNLLRRGTGKATRKNRIAG